MFLARVSGKCGLWVTGSFPCHCLWNPHFLMQSSAQSRLATIICQMNKWMEWMSFPKIPVNQIQGASHTCSWSLLWFQIVWSKSHALKREGGPLKICKFLLTEALKNKEKPLLWDTLLPAREGMDKGWLISSEIPATMPDIKDKSGMTCSLNSQTHSPVKETDKHAITAL